MDDFIARTIHEQNVRDGLVAKAPPRMPNPDELNRLKGCESLATTIVGAFLIVVGVIVVAIAT